MDLYLSLPFVAGEDARVLSQGNSEKPSLDSLIHEAEKIFLKVSHFKEKHRLCV